jgi:hypothetical protein
MGALVQTLPHHHRLRPAKEGSAPSSPVPGFLTGPRFDASAAFAHAPARRVARLSTRPTPFGAAETFTPELSSPQVTPRRSRVSLRSCLDSCCDGTCIRWESAVMGCNFAPGALPPFVARMAPSDSPPRRPSELRLPALYPRSSPHEPVDLAGPQALPLCPVPACCRLHPGSLDGFVSPTHPPPIPAFARRQEARRLHSQLSQLCPLGIR